MMGEEGQDGGLIGGPLSERLSFMKGHKAIESPYTFASQEKAQADTQQVLEDRREQSTNKPYNPDDVNLGKSDIETGYGPNTSQKRKS